MFAGFTKTKTQKGENAIHCAALCKVNSVGFFHLARFLKSNEEYGYCILYRTREECLLKGTVSQDVISGFLMNIYLQAPDYSPGAFWNI
jgi:hypothetical protein